jgi:hypothetical protein
MNYIWASCGSVDTRPGCACRESGISGVLWSFHTHDDFGRSLQDVVGTLGRRLAQLPSCDNALRRHEQSLCVESASDNELPGSRADVDTALSSLESQHDIFSEFLCILTMAASLSHYLAHASHVKDECTITLVNFLDESTAAVW